MKEFSSCIRPPLLRGLRLARLARLARLVVRRPDPGVCRIDLTLGEPTETSADSPI